MPTDVWRKTVPLTDVYTITATSKSQGPITGLFLNVINDPSNGLPSGGPGRYPGDGPLGVGNFVVSEFTADVSRPNALAADPPSVPLPAAFVLFATGLGGLGLLGWRRKKTKAT